MKKTQLNLSLMTDEELLQPLPTEQYSMSLVEAALMSRYVKLQPHQRPISLFLISPYGEGKSFVLKRYIKCRNIYWISEATAYGLHELLVQNKTTTLIVTDFVKLIYKKPSTANSVIATILVSTSDGYRGTLAPNVKYDPKDKQPHYLQLLTAMPTDYFLQKLNEFNVLGFWDRFIIANVSYSTCELEIIKERILRNLKLDTNPIKLKFPRKLMELSSKELKEISEFFMKKHMKLSNFTLKNTQKNMKLGNLTLRNMQNCLILLYGHYLNRLEKGLNFENTSILDRLVWNPMGSGKGQGVLESQLQSRPIIDLFKSSEVFKDD